MNLRSTLTLAILLGATAPFASAQDSAHAHGPAPAAHEGSSAAELTAGEVKKIDKEAGKITLRHGEIKNLNMAAMTMVLRVKDPALLDRVEVGDQVRFAAERLNGAVTIVQMQKAQ
jgi:Cu/Ag efflux protein CusF